MGVPAGLLRVDERHRRRRGSGVARRRRRREAASDPSRTLPHRRLVVLRRGRRPARPPHLSRQPRLLAPTRPRPPRPYPSLHTSSYEQARPARRLVPSWPLLPAGQPRRARVVPLWTQRRRRRGQPHLVRRCGPLVAPRRRQRAAAARSFPRADLRRGDTRLPRGPQARRISADLRRIFGGPGYQATRTFRGSVDWSPTSFHGREGAGVPGGGRGRRLLTAWRA